MKKRICTICGYEKLATTEYFPPDKRRPDGLQSHCRECERKSKKEHSDKMRLKIAQYKLDLGCADCNYKKHHAALEFDHINDNKKYDIANMTRLLWKNILKEILKCEVVCSNCHRIREWVRKQDRKNNGNSSRTKE